MNRSASERNISHERHTQQAHLCCGFAADAQVRLQAAGRNKRRQLARGVQVEDVYVAVPTEGENAPEPAGAGTSVRVKWSSDDSSSGKSMESTFVLGIGPRSLGVEVQQGMRGMLPGDVRHVHITNENERVTKHYIERLG
jgi:hypothetical protein